MLLTLDTSHFEMSTLNDMAVKNMADMSVTLDTSHSEMLPLKDAAIQNMPLMSVTLDTSHFEISPSKRVRANILCMSVTFDTSHSMMGPCGAPVQFAFVNRIAIHDRIALASPVFDCGENVGHTHLVLFFGGN